MIKKILKKNIFYYAQHKFILSLMKYCAWRNKGRLYDFENVGPLKVNIGSGLLLAKGWIHIDYNIPALVSRKSSFILNHTYKVLQKNSYSELNRPFRFKISQESFVNILSENEYILHNVLYGLPFRDNKIDYCYSSHMIGYSFSKEKSKYVLKEVFRALKPGGSLRLSVIDGDYYWKVRDPKIHNLRNDNCFRFEELKEILNKTGFRNIKRCSYKTGEFPEQYCLDDYSEAIDQKLNEKTLYVDASK